MFLIACRILGTCGWGTFEAIGRSWVAHPSGVRFTPRVRVQFF